MCQGFSREIELVRDSIRMKLIMEVENQDLESASRSPGDPRVRFESEGRCPGSKPLRQEKSPSRGRLSLFVPINQAGN